MSTRRFIGYSLMRRKRMLIDHAARKDFYRDIWRMFVLYATSIRVKYYEQHIHIIIELKEPIDNPDDIIQADLKDWNVYTEKRWEDGEQREETATTEELPTG
jgi:hypothetical protein